jgi:xanthosine utilization system XapX-like protein
MHIVSLIGMLLSIKIERISSVFVSMRRILVSLLNGTFMQHVMGKSRVMAKKRQKNGQL